MIAKLSLPELILLIDPGKSSAHRCMQGALTTLIARADLHVTRSDASVTRVAVRTAADPALPPVAAVFETVRAAAVGGSLDVTPLLVALQRRFGSAYGTYLSDHVFPGLERRGLLTRQAGKHWGLFPFVHYHRTAAADALLAPLHAKLAELQRLPKLRSRDPQRARAIASRAGLLVLLSAPAMSVLPALRSLPGSASSALDATLLLPRREAGWEEIADLAEFAVDVDWTMVLHWLDGMHLILDGSEAGNSDSSDGGGDGGGGD